MGRYRYQNVQATAKEPQSIQLLNLQPVSNQRPYRFLQCYIIHAPISSPPSYEAISYCLGDASDLLRLSVQEPDNKESWVSVTRSLYGALLHLRLRDRPRLLWADAVCINQKDEIKKIEQIQLMRQIYQTVTEVVIWLGNADTKSDKALALIPFVVEAAQGDAATGVKRNLLIPQERPDSFPW